MLKPEKENVIPDILKEFLQKQYKMEFKKQLGKGSFGEVYEILVNNVPFAIKIFRNDRNNTFEKKISNEIKFSLYLMGNNVIRTLKSGSAINDGKKYYFLFMEKAKFRDLSIFIHNFFQCNLLNMMNSKTKFPWIYNFSEETIKFFAYQIIESLKFLDFNSLIHFDLKPENLLLGDNFIVKLSDFSEAIQFNHKQKYISIQNGTYHYMSPEYYNQDKEVTVSVAKTLDFFSFGCILYNMITREDLIKANFNEEGKIIKPKKSEVENYIKKGIENMKNCNNYSDELKILINKLINIDPEKRPTINELILDKWINQEYDIVKKVKDINAFQKLKIFVELQKVSCIKKVSKKRRKFNIE